jgi:hypothetical protein
MSRGAALAPYVPVLASILAAFVLGLALGGAGLRIELGPAAVRHEAAPSPAAPGSPPRPPEPPAGSLEAAAVADLRDLPASLREVADGLRQKQLTRDNWIQEMKGHHDAAAAPLARAIYAEADTAAALDRAAAAMEAALR